MYSPGDSYFGDRMKIPPDTHSPQDPLRSKKENGEQKGNKITRS